MATSLDIRLLARTNEPQNEDLKSFLLLLFTFAVFLFMLPTFSWNRASLKVHELDSFFPIHGKKMGSTTLYKKCSHIVHVNPLKLMKGGRIKFMENEKKNRAKQK